MRLTWKEGLDDIEWLEDNKICIDCTCLNGAELEPANDENTWAGVCDYCGNKWKLILVESEQKERDEDGGSC